MAIDIGSFQEEQSSTITGLPTIRVFGVGGGGGNVVNRMIEAGISGVEYVVANTDAMVLNSSKCNCKINLGNKISKGVGAGMNPEVGRLAAEEDQDSIKQALEGADMIFIAAGMGGGTGTGAAPVVAELAKEMQILTVGVVTTPFRFEGRKRARIADSGINEFRKHVDTLMVIPNNKLLEIVSPQTTMNEAFALADDVLKQAISGITNLLNLEGIINLDFADIRTVMANKGRAFMGTGIGYGEQRGLEAAKNAIASPLLSDKQISGATGVIINIVADANFSLMDAEAAAELIENSADQDADVIFGFVQDENKTDEVSITVIATGFQNSMEEEQEQEQSKKGPKLRVVDSMKNQVNVGSKLETLKQEEVSKKESQIEVSTMSNPPSSKNDEDVLELDSKFIHPVEKKLHIPEYLNEEKGNGSQKSEVDYDIPTFIRQSRGINNK